MDKNHAEELNLGRNFSGQESAYHFFHVACMLKPSPFLNNHSNANLGNGILRTGKAWKVHERTLSYRWSPQNVLVWKQRQGENLLVCVWGGESHHLNFFHSYSCKQCNILTMEKRVSSPTGRTLEARKAACEGRGKVYYLFIFLTTVDKKMVEVC